MSVNILVKEPIKNDTGQTTNLNHFINIIMHKFMINISHPNIRVHSVVNVLVNFQKVTALKINCVKKIIK